MNRGPALASKLITTWIITGRMQNRNANTTIRINCNPNPIKQTDCQINKINKKSLSYSESSRE